MKTFTNLTLRAMPSLHDYYQKLRELAAQLADVDQPVSKSRLIIQLVSGLPAEYDVIAAQLHKDLPPWEDAINFLDAEERRQQARQSPVVAAIVPDNPQPPSNPPAPRTSPQRRSNSSNRSGPAQRRNHNETWQQNRPNFNRNQNQSRPSNNNSNRSAPWGPSQQWAYPPWWAGPSGPNYGWAPPHAHIPPNPGGPHLGKPAHGRIVAPLLGLMATNSSPVPLQGRPI
ncbi:branchpoint-bridging protein-like [Helianthus annuus]|uniref:branchpoint-bridging protein-like n=1 Tax=Helianthus annuus TaxID=4232 RepID=UPI0016532C76|nr:branchpoint-bridging protein-like [Helianthus annuus]